jgi:hypothetical protein
MRRALAIVLALPPLVYSAAALLWGYFDAFMQCDEICRDDSADWRYSRGAWQWHLLGGLGAVAFVAGIGFFGCVVARRPAAALVCLLLGTAAIVAGLTGLPVNPGSDQDLTLGPAFILSSVAVLISGVLAVVVTATARQR